MSRLSRPRHSSPQDDLRVRSVMSGRYHDPFEVLGRHPASGGVLVRLYVPHARSVHLIGEHGDLPCQPAAGLPGIFTWTGPDSALPARYRYRATGFDGRDWETIDPYCFGPGLGDLDLHLFGEGRHWHLYRVLGAHPQCVDGIEGVRFATWAPGAERVSVVGEFNGWDGRIHPMRVRGSSGVWELFLPGVTEGELYKFEILPRHAAAPVVKTDPFGRAYEMRPATAARVMGPSGYHWHDGAWMTRRERWNWQAEPLSIYEVHLGSWRRASGEQFLNYRELAHQLVAHVADLGFTHLELLPITEHPLDDSWGYQTTGYYAPTSRFGTPDDFRYFVDYCHQHGLGVILDWVPAHFPKDEHALARYDGTALFEHEDPRRGEHRDWGTYIYNYGRNEVRNFLLASALFWLEEFHLDGLRVDAVASMLYLDYSREPGDWVPNVHGGNENLEAIGFLRELNTVCHGQVPGVLVIAEESTAWPQVTRPTWVGGLGFTLKWNMGWMHDTLDYLSRDPVYRHFHHDRLTFGLLYAFSENFLLPLSHDEVVHGKGSLINKMPGDEWQRFANLRLLFAFQYTYPGAKLLFMGGEFAQHREWAHQRELDWSLLSLPSHGGVMALVRDLNGLYRDAPALHSRNYHGEGFEWIDCHDATQSVIAFQRIGVQGGRCIVVINFTPVPRRAYRIGVPLAGRYRECLNTDSVFYGGSNVGNGPGVEAAQHPLMGHPYSIELDLPPLAALILVPEANP